MSNYKQSNVFNLIINYLNKDADLVHTVISHIISDIKCIKNAASKHDIEKYFLKPCAKSRFSGSNNHRDHYEHPNKKLTKSIMLVYGNKYASYINNLLK
jgi:hypothetical protein